MAAMALRYGSYSPGRLAKYWTSRGATSTLGAATLVWLVCVGTIGRLPLENTGGIARTSAAVRPAVPRPLLRRSRNTRRQGESRITIGACKRATNGCHRIARANRTTPAINPPAIRRSGSATRRQAAHRTHRRSLNGKSPGPERSHGGEKKEQDPGEPGWNGRSLGACTQADRGAEPERIAGRESRRQVLGERQPRGDGDPQTSQQIGMRGGRFQDHDRRRGGE